MKKHGQIELYQLFFLLVHVQVGVSIITLPYDIFLVAKSDAWISILIAGGLVQIIILLFGIIIKRFPNNHLFEISEMIFFKWFGKIIAFVYIIYFLLIGVIILNKYALIISAWMMPLTPSWLLISLVVFISTYIATAELPIIARSSVIVFFVFIIYIVLGLYALKSANITYVLPIGDAGMKAVIKGVYPAILSFVGFGTLLTFAPYTKGTSQQIVRVASIANAFVTLFYLFITLVVFLVLSPKEIILVPEPVLYIVKAITFKVIERPDLLFTAIWIVFVIGSYALFIYVSSVGLQQVFNMKQRKKTVYISIIVSFFISISFKGTYTLVTITDYYKKIAIIFSIILPIIIVLYVVFFGKRSKESE